MITPFVRLISASMMLSVLFGCIGPGSNTPVTPLEPEQFPRLGGISLLGDEVTLPDAFEGELNLVSLGFVQGHQDDINTWIDVVPELTKAYPALRFYEVPVIYEAGPLFRWWLNNGMRIGVVEEEARRRTITVYTDREQFSQAVALPNLEDIHTLLLDENAQIRWRATGPITEEARQRLIRAIEQQLRS